MSKKTTKLRRCSQSETKTISMNIRNQEYFEVKFANTERLKNSAIPSMQRILNKDYLENQAGRIRNPG